MAALSGGHSAFPGLATTWSMSCPGHASVTASLAPRKPLHKPSRAVGEDRSAASILSEQVYLDTELHLQLQQLPPCLQSCLLLKTPVVCSCPCPAAPSQEGWLEGRMHAGVAFADVPVGDNSSSGA